jgi:hypothetical protein
MKQRNPVARRQTGFCSASEAILLATAIGSSLIAPGATCAVETNLAGFYAYAAHSSLGRESAPGSNGGHASLLVAASSTTQRAPDDSLLDRYGPLSVIGPDGLSVWGNDPEESTSSVRLIQESGMTQHLADMANVAQSASPWPTFDTAQVHPDLSTALAGPAAGGHAMAGWRSS